MRIGSLFSGYGGLEQGVQAILGGSTAWHSEIDPGACKILAHRYPDVPNHGDITTIDWSAVEPVDVLTGGSPCQDLSAAGKRAGMTEGTRSNLWVSMREAIAQLHPGLVVWENVRGALSAKASSDMELAEGRLGAGDDGPFLRALGRVLGDLADLGYDASWQGLRASDVGAPHGRFRVFVIAWPATDAADERSHRGRNSRNGWAGSANGGLVAADPEGHGRHERRTEPARVLGGSDAAIGSTPATADTDDAADDWQRPRLELGAGGTAAADTDRYAVRIESVRELGSGSASVTGHAGADIAADTYSDGLGGLGRLHPIERDADGCGGPDRDGDNAESTFATNRACDSRRLQHGDDVPAVEWGPYAEAIRRWERVTRPAPAPTEMDWGSWRRRRRSFIARRQASKLPAGRRGQIPREMWAGPLPRLSPRFVEWLMGLPAGWVTDVPGLTRNEQLKALGNGVVPQQAAEALRLLLPDIETVAA